ncbi:MAG: sigma-E processing peptidase SpoIIGA [Clostridiales bacterium]|mgnify:CR=1 FL=1|nr:sigma-E processing peptidase SpoIIGA [Clostridiales bacterium]
MVIYGEYLFIENGLVGFAILYLTKKLCGFEVQLLRIVIGSIFCGIYAFVIFLENIPWWGELILKISFSFGIVAWVFSFSTLKRLIQGTLVFYLVSFAMGGIVIGSMYFLKMKGITSRGAFYIERITYLQVFLGIILASIILSVFASFIKDRIWKGMKELSVKVSIGSKSDILKGMIDTGNFLADPISGKPVFLVSEKVIRKLLPDFDDRVDETSKMGKRFRIIPYKSVGKDKGFLIGIRPDEVLLLEKGNEPRKVDIILAVHKGKFPVGRDGNKYDLLIHPEVMEGGILEGE